MIGQLDVIVLDCPDTARLASFYSELLGMTTYEVDADWAEIGPTDGGRPLVAFQRVDGYTPPTWPTQDRPQQLHLDVRVPDLDAGEAAVLAIGAAATGEHGESFRVYLDPAGHPFCLISPQD